MKIDDLEVKTREGIKIHKEIHGHVKKVVNYAREAVQRPLPVDGCMINWPGKSHDSWAEGHTGNALGMESLLAGCWTTSIASVAELVEEKP